MTQSLDKAIGIIDQVIKDLDAGRLPSSIAQHADPSPAPATAAKPQSSPAVDAHEAVSTSVPAENSTAKPKGKKKEKKAPTDPSNKPWLKAPPAPSAADLPPFEQADLRVRHPAQLFDPFKC